MTLTLELVLRPSERRRAAASYAPQGSVGPHLERLPRAGQDPLDAAWWVVSAGGCALVGPYSLAIARVRLHELAAAKVRPA